LESPFSALDGLITPTERFYVRSHFPKPAVSVDGWRLKVEGMVERPFELSYEDLLAMPATTQIATLECAGNARVSLVPQVPGAQWGFGAVSTAEWTGVPLAALLQQAKLTVGAVDVVLEGADQGAAKELPAPPATIHYARSLPVSKAEDGVLLAYFMNGERLPASHGFPLRAVVPGWYGMASVKWLSRIIVTDRPFQGYFQTTDYAHWERRDGIPVRVPIREMQVKAQIARPAPHEVVPRDTDYRMFGAAWSGSSNVIRVEVSRDGGKTYSDAHLLGSVVPYTWRLWEYSWRTPGATGPIILMVRATDASGHSQPGERDADWGTYVVCHTLPVEVQIR